MCGYCECVIFWISLFIYFLLLYTFSTISRRSSRSSNNIAKAIPEKSLEILNLQKIFKFTQVETQRSTEGSNNSLKLKQCQFKCQNIIPCPIQFCYKTYIIFSRLCDCLDIQCCVVNLHSENILIDSFFGISINTWLVPFD